MSRRENLSRYFFKERGEKGGERGRKSHFFAPDEPKKKEGGKKTSGSGWAISSEWRGEIPPCIQIFPGKKGRGEEAPLIILCFGEQERGGGDYGCTPCGEKRKG